MSTRILARVMIVVLSGDRQSIVIIPTNKYARAAQALLQLAAGVKRNHTLEGRCAPRPTHSTNVLKSPNHSAIYREQERGGKS